MEIELRREFENRINLFKKINDKILKNNYNFLKGVEFFRSRDNKFSIYDIKNYWKKHIQVIKKHERVTLYIHIPFCLKKCDFCCYSSNSYNKPRVDKYLDLLEFEMEYFKDTFNDFEFDGVYVGGGTPNILTITELKRLYEKVFSTFKFKENMEAKIEMNPFFSTKEKLEYLKSKGFNKVSFGVQSFDGLVLKNANRFYQQEKHVERSIKDANEVGFFEVNADLMFGLEGDNTEKFIDSLEKLMKIGPNSIIIYKLMPTPEYFSKYIHNANNISEEIFTNRYDLNMIFRAIKDLSKEYGYDCGEDQLNISEKNMGISLKKKSHNRIDGYSYLSANCASCFGIGTHSQSHIFGDVMYQNRNYPFDITENESVYAGNEISDKREIISLVVENIIREGKIEVDQINKELGIDFFNLYQKEIEFLLESNYIKIVSDEIYLLENSEISEIELLLFFGDKNYIRNLITNLKEVLVK